MYFTDAKNPEQKSLTSMMNLGQKRHPPEDLKDRSSAPTSGKMQKVSGPSEAEKEKAKLAQQRNDAKKQEEKKKQQAEKDRVRSSGCMKLSGFFGKKE